MKELAGILSENVLREEGQPEVEKKITTSYYVVDEESSEAGEAKERGWLDKEGESMTPDEYDREDGITAVDIAVKFLLSKGATEPSSSHYHGNIWYSATDPDRDYSSGEETYYDYHLNGFSEQEGEEIFNRVKRKR